MTVDVAQNDSAMAAKKLINLMGNIFAHENQFVLYGNPLSSDNGYNPEFFKTEGNEWSRKFLVAEAYRDISVKASELLTQWIDEVFNCPIIVDWAKNRLERKYKNIAYILNWEANFEREKEAADFIDDDLVPVGEVHYRYVYSYSSDKEIFVKRRVVVSDKCERYWKDNAFWFDYYGPEENSETGLIFYLDY